MVLSALAVTAAACGGGKTPNARVAPNITSTPPVTATVGVPFDYVVSARGMTPVTFAVQHGPEGFEVHPTSGLVRWTPTREGTESIALQATNLAGTDAQSFDVIVTGLEEPVFTTSPPTEATVGAAYAYDPAVVAEGEVSWRAPLAPEGLTIDATTGAVRWTADGDG